jgi:hypothetical protein
MIKCSPFSHRGSKWLVAHEVWERLGDPKMYIEPFGGTLAMLLSRPATQQQVPKETVGDKDCLIAHFWRAVRKDPHSVAWHFVSPVSQIDLKARHKWLRSQRRIVEQKMLNDPDWFDSKIAGYWAWGQDLSCDGNWCGKNENYTNTLPWSRSMSMVRQFNESELAEYYEQLALRLRNVGMVCGDWQDTVDYGMRKYQNIVGVFVDTVGVFIDPPYSKESGRKARYAVDDWEVAHAAAEWCRIEGQRENYRIAFCGLAGEHEFPDNWICTAWESQGGRSRRKNERIWFSPHCLV